MSDKNRISRVHVHDVAVSGVWAGSNDGNVSLDLGALVLFFEDSAELRAFLQDAEEAIAAAETKELFEAQNLKADLAAINRCGHAASIEACKFLGTAHAVITGNTEQPSQ